MITVAKNAGFCFGVKRAVDTLLGAIESKREGERIFTLGTLIHNGVFNAELAERGIKITNVDELDALAKSSSESSPVTVFLRAHGVPKETEELLISLAEKHKSFRYVDCTCPFVKKIHNIAKEHSAPDNVFLLFGKADHPEVVGIMSYFDYEKLTFNSADELSTLAENGFFTKKLPTCCSIV